MARTGSCYCGNVAYEFDDADNNAAIICYCTTCQKIHSDHSLNLKTEVPKVRLTKGSTKIYDDNGTDSGKTIHRNFCGDCGSQLWSDPEAIPGVRFLKAGTLDDRQNLKLVGEIYCESAMPHNIIPKDKCGQKHYEGMMAKEI